MQNMSGFKAAGIRLFGFDDQSNNPSSLRLLIKKLELKLLKC